MSTPAMDQVAESGLIFTNGYVTGYNCAPTRVGLLTGRYQQRTGFYQARNSREGMSLDEITIAELLKTKGYTTGYLTDILGDEAEQFIGRHAADKDPFFLYLSFNAVHYPLQAPEEDIRRFNHENPDRNIYLAMLYRMDIAIANVIDQLKKNGVYDNTIIFMLSDNGGARAVSADILN